MSVLADIGGLLLSMFSYPAEIFTAALVFSLPLEHRRRWRLRAAALALGMILPFCGVIQYQLEQRNETGAFSDFSSLTEGYSKTFSMLSSLFWCSVLFFGAVLLVWFCCVVPFREALYCGTCAYLMEHTAYCVCLLLGELPFVEEVSPGHLLYYLVYGSVYYGGYVLFSRRMVQNGHYATHALDSLGLTAGTLAVVMVMSIAASSYGFTTIHALYAMFCCWYALYGQLKQQLQLNLQGQLRLQEQLWVQQKNQYELSRETIAIINRKCHDMKHQIAALRAVEDSDYKNRLLDELQAEVMIYDAAISTGNPILDTVLTEKSLHCQQHGIELSCMADGGALGFMDAADLYTLFGNGLDNAIEAVQKLPPRQRTIHLSVRQKAGLVLIQLENPYEGELVLENGLPKTSKGDTTSHGFGVGSIRLIAEKYEGIFRLDTTAQQFTLRIAIPLSEQNTTAFVQSATAAEG